MIQNIALYTANCTAANFLSVWQMLYFLVKKKTLVSSTQKTQKTVLPAITLCSKPLFTTEHLDSGNLVFQGIQRMFCGLQSSPSESTQYKSVAGRAGTAGPAARKHHVCSTYSRRYERRFRQRSACAMQTPPSLGEPSSPSTAPLLLGQGCRIPAEPVRDTVSS